MIQATIRFPLLHPLAHPRVRQAASPARARAGRFLLLGTLLLATSGLTGCDDDENPAARTTGTEDGNSAGPTPTPAAPASRYVNLWSPGDGETVVNPVTFRWRAGSGVATVTLAVNGTKIHRGQLPADQGSLTYDFSPGGSQMTAVLTGYDPDQLEVASDQIRFTPLATLCPMDPETGFNGYVVEAINDWNVFPRDGTYPYCWTGDCGGPWGQIHDGYYAGDLVFVGGEDCFCSGHTLELFLRAFDLFLQDNDLPDTTLFTHDANKLTLDDLYLGEFYQYWQGWGVTDYASAADALVWEGIGVELLEEDWPEVRPGDFVNIWRTNGSGHSVIFVNWIEEDGLVVGFRYYGCNTSGDRCPDPDDPANDRGISGPSFDEEYFEWAGGDVIPELLFIGRPFLPDLPN